MRSLLSLSSSVSAFFVVFRLTLTTSFAADDGDFCDRGYQVATLYHECWLQAKYDNEYPALKEKRKYLDADFLEKYATFMCNVVKPQALSCFKKKVADCGNRNKLIVTADESGGACQGKELNPYFKEHVIKHLIPVTGNKSSPCYSIGDQAYDKCSLAASETVLGDPGPDSIQYFPVIADRFFDTYWTCLVNAYQYQAKTCPHWQIPMLLLLQETALPSLFGMKLKPHQVAQLKLVDSSANRIKNGDAKSETEDKVCRDLQDKPVYVFIEVLTKKPSVSSGNGRLLIQLTDLQSDSPAILLHGGPDGSVDTGDEHVWQFMHSLADPKQKKKAEVEKDKWLASIDSGNMKSQADRQKKEREELTKKMRDKKKKKKMNGMKRKEKKGKTEMLKKIPRKKESDDIYDRMIN